MKFEMLMKVMDCGDKHGSAFKDILAYYGIEDNDLSHIDDEMAEKWLSRQKCKCWQKGHWFFGNIRYLYRNERKRALFL